MMGTGAEVHAGRGCIVVNLMCITASWTQEAMRTGSLENWDAANAAAEAAAATSALEMYTAAAAIKTNQSSIIAPSLKVGVVAPEGLIKTGG